MIGIKLHNNISCDYICKCIQKLVADHSKNNLPLEDNILTINIVKVTDGNVTNKTLCIEHH